MTSPSNVPPIEITDTGAVIPDTPSTLAGVLLDYRDAFGKTLNIQSLSTPQGYLAQETTANLLDVYAAIAYIFNNVDPAYASGRMQDAIARIYFIERKQPQYTIVEAICTGQPFGTLPAGSLAKDDENYIYASTGVATFNAGGQATVQFQCQTPGPIAVGVGELSRISVAVDGWDAVTNTVPGVPGTDAENRSQFERRRRESVAINSHSTPAAIYANVIALDGVLDGYCVDNPTGATVNFGETNYPLKPHSVLVSVEGGNDQEIAEKIWERKDPGCDMNGNTTAIVTDDAYASNNKPTYTIAFLRPTHTTIKFRVVIEQSSKIPSDIITLTRNAVISAFNGNYDDKDRERIAGTIFASKYYAPIQEISEEMSIISVFIGLDGDANINRTLITMGVDQFPVVSADDITVELVE